MNRYEARFSPLILDPVIMRVVPAAFSLFEEFDALNDEEARKKLGAVQANLARREGPLCPFNYDPAKMRQRVAVAAHVLHIGVWTTRRP